MMKLGFTGTQVGMSERQKAQLVAVLVRYNISEFHHGDCIGADAEADAIARAHGIPITIHPPIIPSKRAYCGKPGDGLWLPKQYLERNHDIVDATDFLVAAPRTDEEELRSGTWATVRYARKRGKKVEVFRR